jgi:hypothetical protein
VVIKQTLKIKKTEVKSIEITQEEGEHLSKLQQPVSKL